MNILTRSRAFCASCTFTIIAATWLAAANPAQAQSRAFISDISGITAQEGDTVSITVEFDDRTPRTNPSRVTVQFAGTAARPDLNTREPDYVLAFSDGASSVSVFSLRSRVDNSGRATFMVPADDNSITIGLPITSDFSFETTETVVFALVRHTDDSGDTSGRSVESVRYGIEIAANKGRAHACISCQLGDGTVLTFLREEGDFPNAGEFPFSVYFDGQARTTDSIVQIEFSGSAVVGADYSADFTYTYGGEEMAGTLVSGTTASVATIRVPSDRPTNNIGVKLAIPYDGVAEGRKTIMYRLISHTGSDGSTAGTNEYSYTLDSASRSIDIIESGADAYARFVNPPTSIVEGSSATIAVEFIGDPAVDSSGIVSLIFGDGISAFQHLDDITIEYDPDTAREHGPLRGDGLFAQATLRSEGSSRANIILTAVADGDNSESYENLEIRLSGYGRLIEGGIERDGYISQFDSIIITIVPDDFSTTTSRVEIGEPSITTVMEGRDVTLPVRFSGSIRPNTSIIRWRTEGSAIHGVDYVIQELFNVENGDFISQNFAAISAREHSIDLDIRILADISTESTETIAITLTAHTDRNGDSAGRSLSTVARTIYIAPSSGPLHFPQDETRIAFGSGTERLYAVLSGPAQALQGESQTRVTARGNGELADCSNPVEYRGPLTLSETCGGFRVGQRGPTGPYIPIRSVALESIGEGAASTGVVVIQLQRPIRINEENLWVRYDYNFATQGGDTLIFNRASSPTALASGSMLDVQMLHNPGKDSDGDGIPDGAEARFGTSPYLRDSGGRPQVTLTRGVADTAYVASGKLREPREHLGVTVTGATTIRAYYLSDTFGYEGGYLTGDLETYGCNGRFPSNYDAPVVAGGCAVVDFQNILPNVIHTIGWFAANERGWATVDTPVRLPAQRIQRIPQVNMALERDFIRREAAEIFIRAVSEAPQVPLAGLEILVSDATPSDRSLSIAAAADRRSFASTLTRTPGDHARERYRIDPNAAGAYTDDSSGFPGMTSYEVGPVNETVVYFIEGVAPSLGRPALTRDDESEERSVVEEGGANYKVTIPVLYAGSVRAQSGHLTNLREVGLTGGAGARMITARFDVPAGFVQATGTSVSLTVTAEAISQGEYAATRTTAATLTWPVVPRQFRSASEQLGEQSGDGDGDGIPDSQDPYPEVQGLPVVVASGTEMTVINPQHHIRPVLPVHELSLGDRTRADASSATLMAQMGLNPGPDGGYDELDLEDYDKYSASKAGVRLPASAETSAFEVTYDFDISGVPPAVTTSTTAEAVATTVAGGRAGVIIPLPEMLADASPLFLYKYRGGNSTRTELFTVDAEPGGNEYGFAPLDDNGSCPTDDGTAASLYRNRGDDGNLNRDKMPDDLCVVLYIVDGGPNDEDSEVNGIIKDPMGTSRIERDDVVMAAAGGGGTTGGGSGGATGGTISGGSGAFGVAGLAGLGILLLALLVVQARRRRVSEPSLR